MSARNVQIDVTAGHLPAPVRPPLSPEEIAKRRAAESGATVATMLLIPVFVLAFVSFSFLVLFAVGLASTPGQIFRMFILMIAVTVGTVCLPTISALMMPRFPSEGRLAMVVWYWLVGLSFVGVASGVLTSEAGEANQWLPSTDSTSRIALASGVSEGALKQVLMLVASVGCSALAGIMLRWHTFAKSECYRLAHGDMQLGSAPTAPQPRTEAISMHTPGDIYSTWLDSRIRPAHGMEVGATRLYEDYSATCDLCGIERMSQKAFGDKLTHFVEQSQGRYLKAKGSDGKTVYRGLALAEDSLPLYEMPQPERIEAR